MTPLNAPFKIARLSRGFAMNQRVAPTICIVFMRNRLLNMASLMVLSIRMITITAMRTAMTERTIPMALKFFIIEPTTAFGNLTSSTLGFWAMSTCMPLSCAESTNSFFRVKSILGGRRLLSMNSVKSSPPLCNHSFFAVSLSVYFMLLVYGLEAI